MTPEQMDAISKFLETPRAFVRVYELPDKLTDGYCFGGGVPITFKNVDWFEHPVGDRAGLEAFIRTKRYIHAGRRYLVLADDPSLTFSFAADDPAWVAPPKPRRVRHLKRGSIYEVLGEAEAQISITVLGRPFPLGAVRMRMLAECDKLVVYRCEKTGKLWARFPDEFNDGRFEEIGEDAGAKNLSGDELHLQLARDAYFAAGGRDDDPRRAQKVSRIQAAISNASA